MKNRLSVIKSTWRENKFQISTIYFLTVVERLFYLFIPSSVGLMIDSFINNRGFGLLAFVITYLGWQITSTYLKIKDTILFTNIFSNLSLKMIDFHQQDSIETTTINARVELMKQVVSFFENDLPFVINSLVSIIGSCILLYLYNQNLLIVSLVVIIPSIVINWGYSKKAFLLSKQINDHYEKQVEIIDKGQRNQQIQYFNKLRVLNIKRSTLEAYNFGLLELFVFIMITISVYLICNTSNMGHGSIVASYGIILRFAYSLDIVPIIITKLATLKDILNRIDGAFEKIE